MKKANKKKLLLFWLRFFLYIRKLLVVWWSKLPWYSLFVLVSYYFYLVSGQFRIIAVETSIDFSQKKFIVNGCKRGMWRGFRSLSWVQIFSIIFVPYTAKEDLLFFVKYAQEAEINLIKKLKRKNTFYGKYNITSNGKAEEEKR